MEVSWTSNAGGDWAALIIAPGFPFQDVTADDFLSFWAYSPDGLAPSAMPLLYFEGAPGTTQSTRFPLSQFTPALPAGRWTQVLVPLSTFIDDPDQTPLDFTRVKAVILGQNQADGAAHTLYLDEVRTLPASAVEDSVQRPTGLAATSYDSHIELSWEAVPDSARASYHLYRSGDGGQNFALLGAVPAEDSLWLDWVGPQDRSAYQYQLAAVNGAGVESPRTPAAVGQARDLSDEEWLDMVQRYTFRYFWDFAHPVSGLARERNRSGNLVTIGGSGFGVMAILVGIERGYISYEQGRDRLARIANFLAGADRFHGAWPHWMDGTTGEVIPFSEWDDGGDLVETAFMAQGLLTARQYLLQKGDSALAQQLNGLYRGIEWNWYRRQVQRVLYWHWSPNVGWQINLPIRGFNETHIVYLLAIASPTHGIPASLYDDGWAGGNYVNGNTHYGWELPVGRGLGGPLFFTHYSYLGFDPRGKRDAYANYFVQGRNQTRINRNWCIDNPLGHQGYGPQTWGLTASDNPFGYRAHAPSYDRDNGTITPTAALSAMPYTPELSLATLKNLYQTYGERLWGPMGFYDAFNLNQDWFATSYLAIDQGPIIGMIENYRSGLLWTYFMANPEIQPMMDAVGFVADSTTVGLSAAEATPLQVVPNPATDQLSFTWKSQGPTDLHWQLLNRSGQVVSQGRAAAQPVVRQRIDLSSLAPGLYLLQVRQGRHTFQRRVLRSSSP